MAAPYGGTMGGGKSLERIPWRRLDVCNPRTEPPGGISAGQQHKDVDGQAGFPGSFGSTINPARVFQTVWLGHARLLFRWIVGLGRQRLCWIVLECFCRVN